jgi:hypothetical protein
VINALNVPSSQVLIASFTHPVEADAFVVTANVFITPLKKADDFSFGGWYRPVGPGNEKNILHLDRTLPHSMFNTWLRVRSEFIRRTDEDGRPVWDQRTFWNERLSVHMRNTALKNTLHLRMTGCRVKLADFSIRKLVPAGREEAK